MPVIPENIKAAKQLYDKELLINKKGDTNTGNNYSKLLGVKLLKNIDLLLQMFKDFDGAFVGIDLIDKSGVLLGKSPSNIDEPDTIVVKLDYTFKDIKPDLIISMYKESGIKKIFEKALNDTVTAGFITTKEKTLILKNNKSIINISKDSVQENSDNKITLKTYHLVLLEPLILTFLSYYLYYFFELRHPEFMDTPKVNLGRNKLYVIYPFNLNDNLKFDITVDVPFSVTDNPESLEGKSFKGWGSALLPTAKKALEKERTKEQKDLDKEQLKDEKQKQKDLDLLDSGKITPKHKKMFLLFKDLQDNLGEDFFQLAVKKFPVEFKLAKMYKLASNKSGKQSSRGPSSDEDISLEREHKTEDTDISDDTLTKMQDKLNRTDEQKKKDAKEEKEKKESLFKKLW